MYTNPYQYNSQANIDRINAQMNELEQMKQKIQQNMAQPSINQTFQLAPNNNGKLKYAGTIDDVAKEQVTEESAFFSKDLSVVWIKNPSGNIRIFEMKETKLKDEKDMLIDALMLQIEELKKGEKYESSVDDDDEPIKSKKPTNLSNSKSIKTK